MNTKTETYYTACVNLEKVVGHSGFITLRQDSDIGWLGYDHEFGYPQVDVNPQKLKVAPLLTT